MDWIPVLVMLNGTGTVGKHQFIFFLSKITYITATALQPTNSASGYITKKKCTSYRGQGLQQTKTYAMFIS